MRPLRGRRRRIAPPTADDEAVAIARDLAREHALCGRPMRSLFDALDAALGCRALAVTRLAAVTWADTTSEILHSLPCDDPLLGLPHAEHLEQHLRQRPVGGGPTMLVVIDVVPAPAAQSGPTMLVDTLQNVVVADAVRDHFRAPDDAVAALRSDRLAALTRGHDLERLATLLDEVQRRLSRSRWPSTVTIDVQPCPTDRTATVEVLRTLA